MVARLAASSPISASTASRMAWVRSSISACFSGGRGADGMDGLRFRGRVFLSSHRFRSCVQRFHQLHEKYRSRGVLPGFERDFVSQLLQPFDELTGESIWNEAVQEVGTQLLIDSVRSFST